MLFGSSGALFSECHKYRYALWRIWDESVNPVMIIGLNPSTASEDIDDPTIRRVKSMAFKWGFGGVFMLNCFPIISADPAALYDFRESDEFDTQCEYNRKQLQYFADKSGNVVFAWGAFDVVKELNVDKELSKQFPDALALVINKDGSPRHPLYVKGNTKLVKYAQTRT